MPEVISNLNQLNGSKIRAGILDDGKLHMIAHVQEYGATIVPKNGDYLMVPMPDGTFRNLKQVVIPSRPFIAQTVTQHAKDWEEKSKDMLLAIIAGNSARPLKVELANKMALDIKQTMSSGNFTANAPLTLERKNGSTPLIDTGSLQGAIRGEVEK